MLLKIFYYLNFFEHNCTVNEISILGLLYLPCQPTYRTNFSIFNSRRLSMKEHIISKLGNEFFTAVSCTAEW